MLFNFTSAEQSLRLNCQNTSRRGWR